MGQERGCYVKNRSLRTSSQQHLREHTMPLQAQPELPDYLISSKSTAIASQSPMQMPQ